MGKVFLFSAVLLLPFLFIFGEALAGSIEISEIAWMGTAESSYCEWIELYNITSSEIDLAGWGIYEQGGEVLIRSLTKKISSGGYYLMERSTPSCPDAVLGIETDDSGSFGGSGLNNSGEHLVLKDTSGNLVDEVNALGKWLAGDKDTKETMQKVSGEWKTLAATPKAPPPASAAALPESSPGSDSATSTSESLESSPGNQAFSGGVQAEEKPKIRALIAGSISFVTGAAGYLEGRAFGFLEKEIVADRYLWSFGDGAYGEGKFVSHLYRFPGRYNASLTVSSGSFSASDYREIKVLPNMLSISEVKPGESSWIELSNSYSEKLNIGRWILFADGKNFVFPDETYILGKAFLVIPEEVNQLKLSSGGAVELRYPTEKVADKFTYGGVLAPGESFQRVEENRILRGRENPGAGKVLFEEKLPPSPPVITATAAVASESEQREEEKISASSASEAILDDQEALALRGYFSRSFYFWGLLSLGVGIIAALGFVAARRV